MGDDAAQATALTVLSHLLADEKHAERFLAVTGLAGPELSQRLGDTAFLGGVLDFVLDDETLLTTLVASTQLAPEILMAARNRLPGAPIRD
jgi:hypothetical protein